MEEKEDLVEDTPQVVDPAGSAGETPIVDVPASLEPPAEAAPDLNPSPRLYLGRPAGLRPANRAARRRRDGLRNDCPPDRRRASGRPPLKPRLR